MTSMLVLRSAAGAAVEIAMLTATKRDPMESTQKQEKIIGGWNDGNAAY
jgi:hypothetical protein